MPADTTMMAYATGIWAHQVRFIGAFGDTDWTQGWTSYLVDADIQ